MRRKYITIIASFPVGIALLFLLGFLGILDAAEELPELPGVIVIWLIHLFTFGLPIVTFVVIGIWEAIHTEDVVPRRKEPLPWEYAKNRSTPGKKGVLVYIAALIVVASIFAWLIVHFGVLDTANHDTPVFDFFHPY